MRVIKLLTCPKQQQSSPPTLSKQKKQIHHSNDNECLQSSDKGIYHDQNTKPIRNKRYALKQKSQNVNL